MCSGGIVIMEGFFFIGLIIRYSKSTVMTNSEFASGRPTEGIKLSLPNGVYTDTLFALSRPIEGRRAMY